MLVSLQIQESIISRTGQTGYLYLDKKKLERIDQSVIKNKLPRNKHKMQSQFQLPKTISQEQYARLCKTSLQSSDNLVWPLAKSPMLLKSIPESAIDHPIGLEAPRIRNRTVPWGTSTYSRAQEPLLHAQELSVTTTLPIQYLQSSLMFTSQRKRCMINFSPAASFIIICAVLELFPVTVIVLPLLYLFVE